MEATLETIGSLAAASVELVGWTIEEGMPPVEATLETTGSLAAASVELVGWTIEEGTPPVEATLETTGSLTAASVELDGCTTEEGMPPVEATISVADVVGVTIEEGMPPVDSTWGGTTSLELDDTGAEISSLELEDSIGLGVVVVGSTGVAGTPSVEPTEGVEDSCTDVWMGLGEGEGVGVRTGVEPTLDTDGGAWLETGGEDSSIETPDDEERTDSEGTPCVDPTSVFDDGCGDISGEDVVGVGSDVESPVLVMGEDETTTVSALSVDEGCKCHSDWKNDDKFDEESSDDCDSSGVGVELDGRTESDVVSVCVAGSVVFANCRLTCRGK